MDQRKVRSLQSVRRFNFERMNRYQSVAEHSLMVAFLADELATMAGCSDLDRLTVLRAAMYHDAPEAVTGDIPFLVRRKLNAVVMEALDGEAIRELGLPAFHVPLELQRVVDFADVLELAMYLQEELQSGNYFIRTIWLETMGRLASYPKEWQAWAREKLQLWAEAPSFSDIGRDLPDAIKH